MKQVFYPYGVWEEVKFGMYSSDHTDEERQDLINEAIYLLSDPVKLKKYIQLTVDEWPKSTERNMTNRALNRQAWLGQAACCYFAKVPEVYVKTAWSMLSEEQRVRANLVADEVIQKWEDSYAKNI